MSLPPRFGDTWASMALFCLLFVLAVSLPPKWATLHFAGLAMAIATGFARREDWFSPAMQTFLLSTTLWLLPVILTGVLQHSLGVVTAPDWSTLLVLAIRMLGIGLGLIVLLQRGWLTLGLAILALLCALSVHVGAGLIDLLTTPNASLTSWREVRINGLVFNPNPFGVFMALAAILSAGLLCSKPHSPALWVLLITAMLCAWMSGSRGALLSTAAGLMVLFPPVSRMRLFYYLCGVAFLTLAYLHLSPAIEGSALQESTLQSNSQRMQIIAFTLEQIQRSPLIGWGVGAYEKLPGHVLNAPHNMWLDLAISSGLLALVGAIAATILLAYRLYRRNSPATHLALAIFATTIFAGTLEYSILDSTHFRGIWVLVTAIACYALNSGHVSGNTLGRTARD